MFDSELIQFLRPYPGVYMVPVLPVITGLSCLSPLSGADMITYSKSLYLRFFVSIYYYNFTVKLCNYLQIIIWEIREKTKNSVAINLQVTCCISIFKNIGAAFPCLPYFQ